MELISKMAGFGQSDIPQAGAPGDRVQVTINLGADYKLEYQKQLPAKVIDHVASTTHQTPIENSMENSFSASIDASPHQV
jgi:hypothetical protein